MDLRRGPARLAFRLGLRRLGRLLWPDPGIKPLGLPRLPAPQMPNAGRWAEHWAEELDRYRPR